MTPEKNLEGGCWSIIFIYLFVFLITTFHSFSSRTIIMKHQQCVNCIFSNWYSNFRDVTFKSKVIKLSPEFVTYLKSDGIVLPDDEQVKYSNDLEGYSDSDDDEDWGKSNQAESQSQSLFPELKVQVQRAIRQLGKLFLSKLL